MFVSLPTSSYVKILTPCVTVRASLVAPVVKNLPANARDARDEGLILGSGRPPWRRAWQPTPVFLPKESRRQRCLVGYNLWGQRVGLKRLSMHTHNVMVLGGGTYGRTQSPSSYYREPESTVPLLQGRAPQEDCCLQARRRALTRL